ncbi:tRNA (N6-threonylcarbamoyladenosine(37)-N6)-methyltransferase TrmO [Algicola sagamiensis]|uniref:tRNA (N6-threonylcarbamoyladenosine(37)-N6)-methyltransferase TrmO n=1 Tax=Algicola sagamiensis TaxID=163869 RepID=UPI000475FB24
MMQISFEPVGILHSPYKQKFAIPRQPRLIPQARAWLALADHVNHPDTLRGIEDFSHLWLVFAFHETMEKGWSNLVRPPRLGGNAKKGVFATRATFRPNAIGMSAVELIGIKKKGNRWGLELAGIDLLDQTPILDIKPYLPYSDSIEQAAGGFADARPETEMTVEFSEQAQQFCLQQSQNYPQLMAFITQVLKQDPRPAYKKKREGEQTYGMSLYEFNIQWRVNAQHHFVEEIR